MSTSTAERVDKHRKAMRASGLRPVQIWVPDTRRAGFADECRRQSLLLASSPEEDGVADWLSDVAHVEGWE